MERHRFVRGVNGRPTPEWNGLKCPPLQTTLRQLRVSRQPFSTPLVAGGILASFNVSLSRPLVRILPTTSSSFSSSSFLLCFHPSSPYMHISSHYSRYTLLHTLSRTSHHRLASLRVLPPNPGYGSKSARPAPDDPSRYRY